jgi:hypothetical protein
MPASIVRAARSCGGRTASKARTGVHKGTTRRYMVSIGWRWVPCMTIGSGCEVHLRPGELPAGRLAPPRQITADFEH